jgi:hypothetical protein
MNYQGWEYSKDVDGDRDCFKVTHYATRNGVRHELDHSPYEGVSQEALAAYVHLGFPERVGATAWRNETIIKMMNAVYA